MMNNITQKNLDDLDKIDKFLEMHNLSKLTHEEIQSVNRHITGKGTEIIIIKEKNAYISQTVPNLLEGKYTS